MYLHFVLSSLDLVSVLFNLLCVLSCLFVFVFVVIFCMFVFVCLDIFLFKETRQAIIQAGAPTSLQLINQVPSK